VNTLAYIYNTGTKFESYLTSVAGSEKTEVVYGTSNFMVSEKEYLGPAVSNNPSNIASQIIYSNLREIVEQQQYMFETLLSKATPSEQRIREIEEGVHPVSTRT
jgi:Icc-related predicted phosphoesterase